MTATELRDALIDYMSWYTWSVEEDSPHNRYIVTIGLQMGDREYRQHMAVPLNLDSNHIPQLGNALGLHLAFAIDRHIARMG